MKYPMLSYRGISFFIYPRKDAKNVLYYRFFHGEKSYHKSTKTTSQKEAIPKVHEAISEVLDATPSTNPSGGTGAIILSQAISEYLGGRITVLRPSTVSHLKLFFKWLNQAMGTLEITQISIAQFHEFLNSLHAKLDPEPSYWRDILSRYNQFWKWCILTRKLSQNLMDGYPRPKASEFRVFQGVVEEAEFSLLCAHLEHRDEFAIRCYRYMGIYPQDYAYAVWEDFYMKDGILHFYKKRGKNHLKFDQPLDGRIEPAIKAIWKTRKPGQRMFVEVPEKGYKTWYYCHQKRIYKMWHHLGLGKHKKLGAFRHTFITEAVDRGVPEDVLLSWMGYSQGSTILRKVYVHRKSTSRYRFVPDLLHQP